MDKKILAGLFVVLGMAGMGFAFYGMNAEQAVPMEINGTEMKGHMETCRAYFESDDVTALRDSIHAAIEAGDEDKIAEIKEQIMENAPEGCRPPMMHRPGMFAKKIIKSLPDEVQEQFKTAFENHDADALKALKEEYFPEPPERMGGQCNCTCAE